MTPGESRESHENERGMELGVRRDDGFLKLGTRKDLE